MSGTGGSETPSPNKRFHGDELDTAVQGLLLPAMSVSPRPVCQAQGAEQSRRFNLPYNSLAPYKLLSFCAIEVGVARRTDGLPSNDMHGTYDRSRPTVARPSVVYM
jgi:hypothetical protein